MSCFRVSIVGMDSFWARNVLFVELRCIGTCSIGECLEFASRVRFSFRALLQFFLDHSCLVFSTSDYSRYGT